MPLMSIPLRCRSRMMKSPKMSLPTFPATTERTPSFASAVAVLAAQPPESARKSCVATNSPATGRRASGGTNRSATKTPAQMTSQRAGYELTQTTLFRMVSQARQCPYLRLQLSNARANLSGIVEARPRSAPAARLRKRLHLDVPSTSQRVEATECRECALARLQLVEMV